MGVADIVPRINIVAILGKLFNCCVAGLRYYFRILVRNIGRDYLISLEYKSCHVLVRLVLNLVDQLVSLFYFKRVEDDPLVNTSVNSRIGVTLIIELCNIICKTQVGIWSQSYILLVL